MEIKKKRRAKFQIKMTSARFSKKSYDLHMQNTSLLVNILQNFKTGLFSQGSFQTGFPKFRNLCDSLFTKFSVTTGLKRKSKFFEVYGASKDLKGDYTPCTFKAIF
jgi:hypothetical protein